MEQIAFVARLRPECKDDYIEAHQNFSSQLREKYLAAGVHQILLFLRGEQLFMYVEADDYQKACASLASDELDQVWQKQVGPMKDPDFQPLTEIFRLR